MNPKNITFEPYSAILERLERGRDFFLETLQRRDFLGALGTSKNDINKKFLRKIVIGEKARIPNSALLAI
ncbi:hypothetical protein LCGC14_2891850, partial [marine sediment metagenome]